MKRRKKAVVCQNCGRRSTGWKAAGGLCPACAQGVRVTGSGELLAMREEQLARARGMAPGRVRDEYIRQIMTDIERIKRAT